MANPYDQFDAASEAKDLATSFGVGSNQLLKMAGDVYGLATGNMDNVVSRQGQENIDYLQQGKSEKLRQAEIRRKAAVDMEEGTLDKALAYTRETFTDPRLFLSTTAESVPSLVGAGGIGAGARAAAGKLLAKKGAETATKIGVGAAVGAGAGMQGTSVGAEQYAEVVDILQKMPEEQALQVPQIARLMTEKGATLEEAKTALALDLARSTGALASLASVGTQLLPGGRTIEKALVGGAGKKIAGTALAGAAMGALGEGVQEAVEEGSGAGLKNLLARAVEPERELTKGVGEAMGAGFSGAAPLGSAAGAASRPSRPVPVGETTAGKSGEPLASDATTSEPRTSITDTPDLSLEGAGEMSTREMGSVLSARDSAARGFTPDPSDIATVEGVRRPQVEVSEEATKAAIVPVQEALDEWRNQNPNVGLNVTVVNDPNLRNTRNYGIRGYFDPNTGEVVINSAFTKPFEVESVVNHEWSHHTLASDEGRTALAEFATREIPATELSDLAKRYPNADNLTLVEEWIARNQEKSPGVFARIVAKIREWLDGKLGIRMTNEEAARVMLRTLRERGAPVAEEGGEMRQSTTDQPLDTASENLNKNPNEPTSVQQEEPRPARALPKSRFYVSSDERGGDFAGAIAEAARVHTKGAAVEVKSPEFYADPENHLYFSEDGRAGAVVKPDGDLVSVFKHPESTAKMRDILTDASQEATKLDGFDIDGFLPNYYSRFGFRPVARVTFNDEFAPPKWDFAENGRPDNVFMVRDPENKLGLPKYDAYSEVRDSVPLVSYDEALKLQQEAIDTVASEKPKGAEPERSSVLAKQPIRESVTEDPVGQTKKQTESPEFKKWFGDWQDPKAFTSRAKGPVSQVFKDGKPLVVYHATTKDFDAFESGRPTFDDMGFFGNVETNRHAIFFSDVPEQAASYVTDSEGRADTGARTIPAYLDMKSPLYLDRNTRLDDLAEETGVNYNWLQNRRTWWELLDGEDGKGFVEGLKKAGYDGIVFEEDPIRPGVEVGNTYAVFEPSQIKSATGNRGTFDPTNPDIRFSVTDEPVEVADLPRNLKGDSEGFIPTYITKQNALPTVVTGKNKTVEIPVIDFGQYADRIFKARGQSEFAGKDITLAEAHVPVIQKYYAGLSPETYQAKDVRAAADMVARDMSNNLLFLHDLALDLFGPEVVKRMSKWYDGANVIAKKFADQYGISVEQSAAILATLSPQKHWFANVSLAENVMDVLRNHQDTVFDAAVEKAARAAIKNSTGTTSSKRVLYGVIRDLSGKKLSDLNSLEEKTVFTRFLSQSLHPERAYIVTPEGQLTPGSSVAVAWSGIPITSNAVSAFLDGSVDNLTMALGGGHKVRNFNGNIIDPMSPLFYTSDTHNVAASLLIPVGGTDFEVSHNFGGNPGVGEGPKLPVIGTTVTGLQGTYPLYLEAGRRAAEQRNVLPRQMQSITWEMIRIMFTDDMKTPAFMDTVKRVHDQVRSGSLDLDGARQKIIELSGGRDTIKARPPEWITK